jgi:hypothetical protein
MGVIAFVYERFKIGDTVRKTSSSIAVLYKTSSSSLRLNYLSDTIFYRGRDLRFRSTGSYNF